MISKAVSKITKQFKLINQGKESVFMLTNSLSSISPCCKYLQQDTSELFFLINVLASSSPLFPTNASPIITDFNVYKSRRFSFPKMATTISLIPRFVLSAMLLCQPFQELVSILHSLESMWALRLLLLIE